ncbi:MAG: hypothetical protein AAGF94_06820 [Pseudomonadota bacterium]
MSRRSSLAQTRRVAARRAAPKPLRRVNRPPVYCDDIDALGAHWAQMQQAMIETAPLRR